jgi:Bacterial SH3 domain.
MRQCKKDSQPTNGTFGFVRHPDSYRDQPFAKPKEPFFAKGTTEKRINLINLKHMKKLFLLALFLLTASIGFSQSYLGWVTKQVNFRQGPGTNYGVISSLKPGTQIFIVSLETENDFYNIIDIATDKEGYIHKSFVKLGDLVKKNERGMFTPSGKTSNYNPEIEIFNNTSLTLTLKLNSETYTFSPKQKKTIR